MNPVTPLKLSSVMFAVLWASWMVWWSGNFAIANIVILAICGGIAGWLWFLAMRWYFRRAGLLPKA